MRRLVLNRRIRVPKPTDTAILEAAEECLQHSSTGTIGLRDVFYTLETRRRRYREPAQETTSLIQISRTLIANGYELAELRPKSYSRYRKIDQ